MDTPIEPTPTAQSRAFPPSRAEALRRLEAFLPRAGRHYASERNADHGPDRRGNVSVLSPYLRHRLLGEQEVVAAVLQKYRLEQADKFVQEVLWRTYWKGWLELRPAVWARYLETLESERARLHTDSALRANVEAAEAGRTGIDGIDDWARELVETGYLHNHARMWFASIWIFTLRLPWALGADFFARHLLDADPASNTLSWRWVAGLQTAGKTYLARADNIARYTDGRFKPRGLADTAEPLIEPPLPAASTLPPRPRPAAGTPALLLAHPEDLDPLSALPAGLDLRAAVLITSAAGWPWGDKARAFVDGACTDTAQRLQQAGLAVQTLDADAATADALADLAAAHGTDALVTPEAPVGPVSDLLNRLAPQLQARSVALTRVHRDWDSQFWPLATRGFFPFRERIPKQLRVLGIG
jgi:deoxyribodipyrimidine photo-lyase